MNTWLFYFSVLLFGLAFSVQAKNASKEKFQTGEKFTYKIHYGWFKVGEAIIETDKEIHQINGRPCYKLDAYGSASSFLNTIVKIRDHWGTYIDTATYMPHRFYQNILESSYTRNEIVDFDRQKNLAMSKRLNDKKEVIDTTLFKVPHHIHDMVSLINHVRNRDCSTMNKDDTVALHAFLNGKTYNIKVCFLRKERLKTKVGTFNTVVMAPKLSKTDLFDSHNAVEVWFSDDKKRIPLKIKLKLFIGSIAIDIKQIHKN